MQRQHLLVAAAEEGNQWRPLGVVFRLLLVEARMTGIAFSTSRSTYGGGGATADASGVAAAAVLASTEDSPEEASSANSVRLIGTPFRAASKSMAKPLARVETAKSPKMIFMVTFNNWKYLFKKIVERTGVTRELVD